MPVSTPYRGCTLHPLKMPTPVSAPRSAWAAIRLTPPVALLALWQLGSGGRTDKLEIYPKLWAGVGLARGGAGTALFGSHEEVANLIWEYPSCDVKALPS